jgi:hypothetical protein
MDKDELIYLLEINSNVYHGHFSVFRTHQYSTTINVTLIKKKYFTTHFQMSYYLPLHEKKNHTIVITQL